MNSPNREQYAYWTKRFADLILDPLSEAAAEAALCEANGFARGEINDAILRTLIIRKLRMREHIRENDTNGRPPA